MIVVHAPTQTRLTAAQQVWGHLAQTSNSILWVESSRQDPQLLPHRAELHRSAVWFRAPHDFCIAPDRAEGVWAAMTVAARDYGFFATVKGRVVRLRRRDTGYPNLHGDVRRWADDATAQSDFCVLCFTPHEAAVWAGGQERLIFGVPMAPNPPKVNHAGIGRSRRH